MTSPQIAAPRFDRPAYSALERVAVRVSDALARWAVRRAVRRQSADPMRHVRAEELRLERERRRAEFGVLLQSR